MPPSGIYPRTDWHRKRNSESHHPGRSLSPQHRQNIKAAMNRRSTREKCKKSHIGLKPSPEHIANVAIGCKQSSVKAARCRKLLECPSILEQQFLPILLRFGFTFAGNRRYWVGFGGPRQGAKNPDFVDFDTQNPRLCVDIFSSIHNSGLKKLKMHEEIPLRKRHFLMNGHAVLILQPEDLDDIHRLEIKLIAFRHYYQCSSVQRTIDDLLGCPAFIQALLQNNYDPE